MLDRRQRRALLGRRRAERHDVLRRRHDGEQRARFCGRFGQPALRRGRLRFGGRRLARVARRAACARRRGRRRSRDSRGIGDRDRRSAGRTTRSSRPAPVTSDGHATVTPLQVSRDAIAFATRPSGSSDSAAAISLHGRPSTSAVRGPIAAANSLPVTAKRSPASSVHTKRSGRSDCSCGSDGVFGCAQARDFRQPARPAAHRQLCASSTLFGPASGASGRLATSTVVPPLPSLVSVSVPTALVPVALPAAIASPFSASAPSVPSVVSASSSPVA